METNRISSGRVTRAGRVVDGRALVFEGRAGVGDGGVSVRVGMGLTLGARVDCQ
jgi:hypothetical protein